MKLYMTIVFWSFSFILAAHAYSDSNTATSPSNDATQPAKTSRLPTTLPQAVTCAATASSKKISAGSSVQVTLEITNTGSKELLYTTSGWPFDVWTVEATREGADVGYSDKGNALLRDHAAASFKRKKLSVGKKLDDSIPISEIYDMSNAGKYHFKFTRQLYYAIGGDIIVTHCEDEIDIVVAGK